MVPYMLLQKVHENDTEVVYQFGPNKDLHGRMVLNKIDGSIAELDPVPVENAEDVFASMAAKLREHWRNGVIPNRGFWAV